MAGLLDSGYWGDTTQKDPATGLTQADRRDPLWAGLIQGGMGLLAASQDLTPAARAQMMAKAGETYGGIPAAMMQQKTQGAQQVLQAQQVKAGQSKLDTQARLAAMAKTPEFQEAVAKLEPDQRMLLQASLDAGDMAHATQILSAASRERAATAETLRKEALADRKEAAAEKKAAEKGFWGNTQEGNSRDILIKGKTEPEWLKDPKNAAAYSQAHSYLSQPRIAQGPGGTTLQLPPLPDINDYPPPGAAPAPTSPTATGTGPKVDVPKPGEVIENPANGSRTGLNPNNPNEIITEFADGSAKITDLKGNPIKTEYPAKVDAAAQNKLTNESVAADMIKTRATDFLAEWKRATPGERVKSILGVNTPLNHAWVALAMAMKGETQYNLGVITGPDLGLLQRAISDPASLSSLATNEKDLERIINKVITGGQEQIEKRRDLMKPPSRFPKKAAEEEFDWDTDPNDPNKLIKIPRKK